MLYCLTNFCMSLAQPDCTARPITFTPRAEYSFSSLLNSGISLTQASHQVAQKSSTTILSFKSSERKVGPSSLGSENCGIRSGCWPNTTAYSKQITISIPQLRLDAAILRTRILFTL